MVRRSLLLLALLTPLWGCSKPPEKPAAGVGMRLTQQGESLVVSETFDGKPARKAGVAPGDVLWGVDGRKLTGMDPQEAAALVAGPEGTEVKLSLRRKDKDLELTLVRAPL